VEVVIYGPDAERLEPLQPEPGGYFAGHLPGVGAGARYRYRLDGGDAFPDPASRLQPEGVHGASEVVDPAAHRWRDEGWGGRPLSEMVIYELHIGTFTPAGTFDGAIERLNELAELGVTAIEVMPIATFSGARNWGYDGVYLFAPAAVYGGPDGFRRLVDAAHERGLAVILDVVYNHLGPEGNYLPAVTGGAYFTDRHHTPWGDAVDYANPGVRDFVLQNALHWIQEYHVDGLRLDATHAILDDSPVHILREIADVVHSTAPWPAVVVAEDERNERRVVLPVDEGGFGLDAVWADDLHHQLRRLAAGDREGYFSDFGGTVDDVVATLRRGWFFEGQHSGHVGAPRGTSAEGIPPQRFVHCIQNHDQVGNRAFGERIAQQVEPAVYRALSALLLLSPYTPLLWMGQEWAASTPFLYFTDLSEELGRKVTEGRRSEFGHFSAFRDPHVRERIPDPQARATFESSRLRWEERESPGHAEVVALYRALLRLRRAEPALREPSRASFAVEALSRDALWFRRDHPAGSVLVVVNFAGAPESDLTQIGGGSGEWEVELATEERRFGGAGEWGGWDGATLRLAGPGAVVLRRADSSRNQAEERA
jgi:maltooligosyltrehalose trehalohydrolase